MNDNLKMIGYDEEFDKLLVVNGWLNRRIVKETRNFYKAYVKKCYEYNYHMDFFEVLYIHLIAMNFSQKKIDNYISKIRNRILEHISSTCHNAFVAAQLEKLRSKNT